MGRNSRDDGLNFKAIYVNGKPIRKSLLKNAWTEIAKQCYLRGCNCYGCNLNPKLETLKECRIKDYVIGYIQLGYYPKIEKGNYNEE